MCSIQVRKKKLKNKKSEEPCNVQPRLYGMNFSNQETRVGYSSESNFSIRPEIKSSLEQSLVDYAKVWEELSKS